MKKLFLATLISASSLLAQMPAFDVASVTPSPPGTPQPELEHMGIADFVYPGGRFTARATSVKFLLEWAYGIQPSQHSNGPAWIATDRYDILAKAEGNPSEAEMKRMVQTLLADRFHLKLSHEQKEISALVIAAGKTPPKLSSPQEGETHGMRFAQMTLPGHMGFHIIATRYTLAQLADAFARQVGTVIVDDTGLEGEYDFTLDLVPEEGVPMMAQTMLISALRDQLGFTVKSEKASVDFYTIEGVEKVAAGN